MATKLYLHREGVGTLPSGTLPTAEQSSLTPDANLFTNEDGSENRAMDTTISAQAQATLTNASTGDTNAHNYYIARWVSPKINQTSIAANTWTLEFANSESNANANFPRNGAGAIHVCCYVWKPSNGTKYGNILDGNSAADFAEAGTTQSVNNGTFTGASVGSLTANDACIVYEMWAIVTQGTATSRTQNIFYDGTTENSTTNCASFLSTPETITFSSSVVERTINENAITIVGTTSRLKTGIRAIAENAITVADTLARLKTGIRSIAETVSVPETLSRVASKFRIISEGQVTISEIFTGNKLLNRIINETQITVADTISRLKTGIRSISETVTVSDVLSRMASKFRTISQTVTVSDAITKLRTVIKSMSETVTLTDSITRLKTAIRSISQTVTVLDTISRMKTAIRSISQSVLTIDEVIREFIAGGGTLFPVIINETAITVSASISRLKTGIRSLTESITISDSITRMANFFRTISQTVTITDSISKVATRLRSISETISVSDTLSRLATKLRLVSESITISDVISKSALKLRSMTEGITISEILSRIKFPFGGGQLFEVVINEAVTISANVTRIWDHLQRIGGKATGSTIWAKRFSKQMKKWKPDWGLMLRKRIGLE